MSRAIVCGVDGSADSQAAVETASTLAGQLGTRLVLVHVMESMPVPYGSAAGFVGPPAMQMVEEERSVRQERAIQLLEHTAYASGVNGADRRVVFGDPAERLAEIADDEDAEMIVVGSRGRGAFKSAFLGSVSNSLVGIAGCPVVIVPRGVSER
jgi:nucleotide-binding universal stress UspA family protein